jgi:hypothetical protein
VRALAGWLCLIALCGLAWYAQAWWADSVRAERERLRAAPKDLQEREQSWGRMLVGRPSGADPIELPEFEPAGGGAQPQTPFLQMPAQEPDATEQPAPTVFEYVVPEGRVLSRICEDFYNSGRSPIPERVAEYNDMRSPDELRAGQKLLLPAWEVLFPGRERP